MSESSDEVSKMERLLDPIRPSDGSHLRNDMSYLYGRDPSILSYCQRPGPSAQCKKNLSSDYEIEESILPEGSSLGAESLSSPTVKVYLRMKPFPRKIKLSSEQEAAYEIVNSTTLLTRIPCLDNTTISSKKNCHVETVCRKFTFTETFGPDTSQLALFERVIQPQMVEFFGGQNCIAMTYGTTNSGKSHTLQGSTSCPGIIPRSLEYVFSNINPKTSPCYKPIHNCDVISLSPSERAIEIETKTKILSSIIAEKHQYINAYKQMQKLLEEESPGRPSQASDAQYLVWVSFAEIYNEIIYDLLSNEHQSRRSPLKLATDNQGRAFIKGLKTVCVNSGSEAYQVLMAGQCNLKVAATALNARSSRSHCIFTITLLKFTSENRSDKVEISRFSFCDLAGSERLKKTLNVGDRLKEAQNINTSLLVLGRCLKSIYEGQIIKNRHDHIGPFRESKLTRLFQQALSGHEPMALIVNINPLPNLYEETQNVLNFSAIAKKIIIQPKKSRTRKSKTRFSLVVAQTAKTATDWDDTADLMIIPENSMSEADETQSNVSYLQEDYEDLLAENERLKRENASLKASNFKRDLQIRNEMANTYTEMMDKLQSDYKTKMEDLEEEQEKLLEWQLDSLRTFYENKLSSRKRKRSYADEEEDDEDDDDDVQDLEAEVARLTSEVTALKSTIKELRKSKDDIETERNTLKYESSLLKEELKSVKALSEAMEADISSTGDSDFIKELQKQLSKALEKIEKYREMLNEAKDEYIAITDDCRAKEEAIAKLEEAYENKKEECELAQKEVESAYELFRETNKAKDILENHLEREMKIRKELEKKLEILEGSKESNKEEINTTEAFIKQEIFSPTEDREEVFLEFRDIPVAGEDPLEVLKTEKRILEEEKQLLKDKLTDSVEEVDKLKKDLKEAKERLDEITVQLNHMRMKSSGLGDDEKSRQSSVEIVFEDQECCVADQNNQTSFCEPIKECKSLQTTLNGGEELIEAQKALDDLKIEFDGLKGQYEVKVLRIKEVEDELGVVKGKLERLESSKVDGDSQNERLVVENRELEVKLKEVTEEKDELLGQVEELERSREHLKTQIEDYEKDLGSLQKEINQLKESEKSKGDQVKRLNEELDFCRSEHVSEISELNEQLRVLGTDHSENSRMLEEHLEKIKSLEMKVELLSELKREKSEINDLLSQCQSEKDKLEIELKKNEEKISSLTSQLEQSKLSGKDKDDEIVRLQKEVKDHITKVSDDSINRETEKEHKRILQELREARSDLERSEKLNSELSAKLSSLEAMKKDYEQTKVVISGLKKDLEAQKGEIKDLERTNKSLIASLDAKDLEMEKFKKNRNQTDESYNKLLQQYQDDLEMKKKEVDRLQELLSSLHEKDSDSKFRAPSDDRGPLRQKDNKPKDIDTSVEASPKSQASRRPRRGRKPAAVAGTPNQENLIPVVELSDSETKRTTRRTAAANAAASTEKSAKKSRRKLLNLDTSGLCDVPDVPIEVPESPAASTRSMRSRRR